MDDGIGFSRLFQHLQRVFYHHGLHVLVPGQSQRMAEGKLHRHCPRDTVLLCPRWHHGHQDGAQAPSSNIRARTSTSLQQPGQAGFTSRGYKPARGANGEGWATSIRAFAYADCSQYLDGSSLKIPLACFHNTGEHRIDFVFRAVEFELT